MQAMEAGCVMEGQKEVQGNILFPLGKETGISEATHFK